MTTYSLKLISRENAMTMFSDTGYWKHVISAWCNINFSNQLNWNHPIWYNSLIQLNGQILLPRRGWPKNLAVKNLFDEHQQVHPFASVVEELQVPTQDWLFYSALSQATQKAWKNSQCEGDSHLPLLFDKVISMSSFTQYVYRELNADDRELTATKWSKLIDDFDYEQHQDCFKRIYSITNIVKYRCFQYRLLHNKIFCNNVLYHWKIKKTQQCDYCNHKQDITHLLYYCTHSFNIWNSFKEKLLDLGVEVDITLPNIIYNAIHLVKNHIANFLTLVVKFYLYRCKCNNTLPSFKNALSEVEIIHNIEFSIAQKRNKLNRHYRKCSPVYSTYQQL